LFCAYHQVNGVRFSPDANRVVSCGSDFYMKVIDLKTGSILFSKGHFNSLKEKLQFRPEKPLNELSRV
jgi:WD40 repeat protein